MSYSARVRIIGEAWYVVVAQGKWHSPLLLETVSGRRTEGKGKVEKDVLFFIPPKNPGPIF